MTSKVPFSSNSPPGPNPGLMSEIPEKSHKQREMTSAFMGTLHSFSPQPLLCPSLPENPLLVSNFWRMFDIAFSISWNRKVSVELSIKYGFFHGLQI
ncbi:hypothetical protein CDAR_87741 [Caerostris darwini]|uniref:Uncharacterized protein n=1 Tax=Caerostris darwini TaxID=1538125 RepID=A0AAV4S781_9ARAC|nr:hypothetical protein CDAR_87741 [Caerostris darwini]